MTFLNVNKINLLKLKKKKNMQATKLFQSGKKQILQKPQRIKIKHKSYRQLLGLDRPKKQIYVESDDENDDFLQKLLKEQQKQKKNKSLHKKKQNSQKKIKQHKIVKRIPDVIQNKKQKLSNSHSSQKDQQKKQKSKQNNAANNSNMQQKSQNNVKQQISLTKQNKIATQRKLKSLNTKSRKDYNSYLKQKTLSQHPTVKVDQTNQPPYVVTNKLPPNTQLAKSSQGFKLLQNNQRSNSNPFLNFKINPIYNPQKHKITHEFKSKTRHPKFKAKILSTNDLIAMTQGMSIYRNSRLVNRQKLFKTAEQQQRFVQSLHSMKKKKYSTPSLL